MTQTLVASLTCVWGLAAVPGIQEVALKAASGRQEAAPVSFAKDIQPILRANCEACHGDLKTSGLDLRTRDAALKGGDHGVAIVPGSADQSRLYRRVAGLEEPSMPMDGTLTAQQIASIKIWIDQGAHWDPATGEAATARSEGAGRPAALDRTEIPPAARNYWAFKLPVQAPPPAVAGRFENPIDRFLEK
jgi:mono/diheme cytochrome c family protein